MSDCKNIFQNYNIIILLILFCFITDIVPSQTTFKTRRNRIVVKYNGNKKDSTIMYNSIFLT